MYPKIAESCFILHFIVFFSFFCNCYCLSSSSSSCFNLRLADVQLLKRKQISLSYVNSTNLFEILFKVKTVKLFPFPLKTLHKSAKLMQTHVVPVLQHWTLWVESTTTSPKNNKNHNKETTKIIWSRNRVINKFIYLSCSVQVKSWQGYQKNQIEL